MSVVEVVAIRVSKVDVAVFIEGAVSDILIIEVVAGISIGLEVVVVVVVVVVVAVVVVVVVALNRDFNRLVENLFFVVIVILVFAAVVI